MAKKRKIVEFPSIPGISGPPIAPSFSPLNPIDSKNMGRRSVTNPKIYPSARAATAIVGPRKTAGIDFTDIQSAIDKVEVLGGGMVLIKSGTYNPQNELTVPSGVFLKGDDSGTTIIDFTSATLSVLSSIDPGTAAIVAEGVSVATAGTIAVTVNTSTIAGTSTTFSDNGVKAGDSIYINNYPYEVTAVASNTSLTIKEVYRGPTITGESYSVLRVVKNFGLSDLTLIGAEELDQSRAVFLNSVDDFKLERVVAKNFMATGFDIRSAFNFEVISCEAINSVSDGYLVTSSGRGLLSNSLCWGNASGGINVAGNDIRIIGCHAVHNYSGIGISGTDISIMGCTISHNNTNGINMGIASTRCQISGNNLYKNGEAGINLASGATHANDIVIQGNNIYGKNPIFLEGGDQRCTVTGNFLELTDSNQAIYVNSLSNTIVGNHIALAANSGTGIALETGGDYNSVIGNVIDGNSKTTTTGIEVKSTATSNVLSGNSFIGLTTNVSDSGTGTIRATRFRPIDPTIEVLSVDPTDTDFTHDVDVTAQTSANTFAVVCRVAFRATAAGVTAYVRANGSSQGADDETAVIRTQVANSVIRSSFIVGTDTSQIFEWGVSATTADLFRIAVVGYHEFTD